MVAGKEANVVGGPVGMTDALLLAHFDVALTIFESKTQRDPTASEALCMQRDVLERVGCGQALVNDGVRDDGHIAALGLPDAVSIGAAVRTALALPS